MNFVFATLAAVGVIYVACTQDTTTALVLFALVYGGDIIRNAIKD